MSGGKAWPLASEQINESVRYEPEENPPHAVAVGAGVQAALSFLAGIVLGVVIIVKVAGESEAYLAWAVFAALLVSGVATILQAVRVWRIGAGHVLMMGTSAAFIAVCVAALVEGGPATMASLVVVSSLFQFLLASRLSWFRRLLTPVVAGIVIMLIAGTVVPILFDTMSTVPDDVSASAGPVAAAVTAVVVLGLAMRGPTPLRIWVPIIGIAAGCAASVPFGLYDEALPKVLDFARGFATRHKWDDAAADRLAAVSEETLAIPMQYGEEDGRAPKRLSVSAR